MHEEDGKPFELEMSWICEDSGRKHQRVSIVTWHLMQQWPWSALLISSCSTGNELLPPTAFLTGYGFVTCVGIANLISAINESAGLAEIMIATKVTTVRDASSASGRKC